MVQYSPEVPNPQTSEWITKHVISIPHLITFNASYYYIYQDIIRTVASESRLT